MSNAQAIRAVRRMMPPPVYTDYQLRGTLDSLVVPGDDSFQLNIQSQSLMSPFQWTQVLRKDPDVLNQVTTRVLRQQINLRYALELSNRAQVSLFVVSFRKNAANRSPAGLIDGEDYIRGATEYNVRLNPAVFKVHYTRDVSLTRNGWNTAPAAAGGALFAGNPETTFKKGQITMKLNTTMREPNGGFWSQMNIDQQPYYNKYWLIAFFYQQGTGLTANQGARVEYDILTTCYNTA